MNLSELNSLDFENVGSWPLPVKLGAAVLLSGALLFAGFWFDSKDQVLVLEQSQKKETELKSTFEIKQKRAANLEAYRAQLDEMRQSFGAMLRQLPDKTEVAELLVDVSQTGLASGLEFELFQPTGEQPKEFYAELPIKLRVVGYYHEFGEFVSGLAALPRIVTMHDMKITQRSKTGDKDGRPVLVMEATAKTYRYLDEENGS